MEYLDTLNGYLTGGEPPKNRYEGSKPLLMEAEAILAEQEKAKEKAEKKGPFAKCCACCGKKEEKKKEEEKPEAEAAAAPSADEPKLTKKIPAKQPFRGVIKKDQKRRVAVSAEAAGGGEEVELQSVAKSDEAKARIRAATEKNMLFSGLKKDQLEQVIDVMFPIECKAKTIIIKQGDIGDNFYIVESGEFQAWLSIKTDAPVKTYKKGDAFGELALMYNCPRAATIKCSKPGALWGLDQIAFRTVVMAANKSAMDNTAMFLQTCELLSPLADEQREKLGSAAVNKTYRSGKVLIYQGEPPDALYLIKSGKVKFMTNDGEGGKTEEAADVKYVGEEVISAPKEVAKHTVQVAEELKCIRIPRADFAALIGDMNEALAQKVLNSMPMFKALAETERKILLGALKERRFKKNEIVFSEGDTSKTFYIICTGTVKITKDDVVIKDRLESGNYFGEMAIIEDKPRMASITATSPTVCFELSRETFTTILGSMNDIIQREKERREQESEEKMRLSTIKFKDLKQLRILGVGTFGRVKLVLHEATNTPYALKCMRKGQIIALKQTEHVMNEKKILATCNHPFLLKMAAAYQDEEEVYMLLELALGGELFTLLQDEQQFDEDPTARFYAANVCAAFEYLHDRNIVYRDLKPENLLLDTEGYLKVVDFGFAKVVPDRTWTLCGTPEYLAPEIIQNNGHGLPVDWWALGILIFEMINGKPPFVADDPMEIYRRILNKTINFSSHFTSFAKKLIAKLLDRNPNSRLGQLKLGPAEVRAQKFFSPINFRDLEEKKIKAPKIPNIKDMLDTSNFDEYEEEDGDEWMEHLTPENNKAFSDF